MSKQKVNSNNYLSGREYKYSNKKKKYKKIHQEALGCVNVKAVPIQLTNVSLRSSLVCRKSIQPSPIRYGKAC